MQGTYAIDLTKKKDLQEGRCSKERCSNKEFPVLSHRLVTDQLEEVVASDNFLALFYRSDRLLRNHDTQIISVAFHSLVEPFLIEGEWCDVRRPSEHAGD